MLDMSIIWIHFYYSNCVQHSHLLAYHDVTLISLDIMLPMCRNFYTRMNSTYFINEECY